MSISVNSSRSVLTPAVPPSDNPSRINRQPIKVGPTTQPVEPIKVGPEGQPAGDSKSATQKARLGRPPEGTPPLTTPLVGNLTGRNGGTGTAPTGTDLPISLPSDQSQLAKNGAGVRVGVYLDLQA